VARDLFLAKGHETLFCIPLGGGLRDLLAEKHFVSSDCICARRAPIISRILGMRHGLPAHGKVVAEDLGMKTKVVTAAINAVDPSYITDEMRKVGPRLYHLFGHTPEVIKALCKIAQNLGGEVDREAVAAVTKQIDNVRTAYGEASTSTLKGHSMDAKVATNPPPFLHHRS